MATTYEVRDGKAEWGGKLLRDWVPVVVARIVDEFDPAKVILFGSVAEGTDGPDSDLDFLVVLDDAPKDKRIDLMIDLRKATRPCTVPRDLLVTSVDDFERRRDLVGTIEYETEHSGTVVYDRAAA